MKHPILFFWCTILCFPAIGQQAEPYIVKGNKYYEVQNYAQAEAAYRKALQTDGKNVKAQYNLATALAQQNKMDEARTIYEQLSQHKDAAIRSASFYNKGVIHTRKQELQESIDAYKNALRNDPSDMEARENLQKALQEQKKQQQKNQDQKKQQQQKNKSKMSQREAEQKLKLLEQKEKEAQERLQKNKERGGSSLPKDW